MVESIRLKQDLTYVMICFIAKKNQKGNFQVHLMVSSTKISSQKKIATYFISTRVIKF